MKLLGLPLCVVEVEGEYGLALTGGGMDYGWEICEAYIRLGFLPPVYFDPPNLTNRGESADDRVIMAAYQRGVELNRKQ